MAEGPKLLYIIVQDVAAGDTEKQKRHVSNSFRYTRPILQSTLQLIGCKARHAFKISKRVFEVLREEFPIKAMDHDHCKHDFSMHLSDSEIINNREYLPEDIKRAAEENEARLKEISKRLYDVQKKRCTVVLSRNDFMDVVCNAMSEYRYLGPNQRNDFALASRFRSSRQIGRPLHRECW